NVFGDVHFSLPGVFLQNPDRGRVNEQLWTVPYELLCYISLAVLALLRVVRWRPLAPAGGVALIAAHVVHRFLKHEGLFIHGPVSGEILVAAFLFGVAIYLYRRELPWSRGWMAGFAAGAILLAGLVPMGDLLLAPVAAYLTMLVGLANPPRIALIRGADYSYGIFLYGFAIQQAFTTLGPWTHVWWLNILVCVPAAALFAAFSWHVVEKPALKLRKNVMAIETWWMGVRRQSPIRA
ncbi:MAG: acyltransferase, partial [Proteobacteria bacterium]|nr:acyltransferase [Pseudomonadota bacterium]